MTLQSEDGRTQTTLVIRLRIGYLGGVRQWGGHTLGLPLDRLAMFEAVTLPFSGRRGSIRSGGMVRMWSVVVWRSVRSVIS